MTWQMFLAGVILAGLLPFYVFILVKYAAMPGSPARRPISHHGALNEIPASMRSSIDDTFTQTKRARRPG